MIKRIVLAGGPAAGKTTIFNEVPKRLPAWKFLLVPEAASIVLAGANGKHSKETQEKIFKLKLHYENCAFTQIKKLQQEYKIVLCDRGLLDGLVYHKKTYDQRLADYGMTRQDAINRYDNVIYLRSVARDRPELYSNATNKNRTDNVDRAAHICRKTEEAWLTHPKTLVIDNSTDFKGKMDKVVWHLIQIMVKG